jgi:hypothetical protein
MTRAQVRYWAARLNRALRTWTGPAARAGANASDHLQLDLRGRLAHLGEARTAMFENLSGRDRMKALGWAMVAAAWAGGAQAQDLASALAAGKPILEERLRYEDVDQGNLRRQAQAVTLRTHLGWETGAWNHLTALVEGEAVSRLSAPDFNEGLNHRTAYPQIADPQMAEINRLQLTWAPTKAIDAVVGRQKLNIDDTRFIGSPSWRQDEQTFDAGRLDGSFGGFSGTYVYILKVDRNLGQTQDYNSRSHGATVAFAEAPQLRLEQAPSDSTTSVGARITGQAALPRIKLAYAAAYASQTPYAANPASFRIPYWMGEVSASSGPFAVKANYESLASNGKRGFSTPLASLHTFQGWADAFTTTPTRGVDDFNLSVTWSPPFRWGAVSAPQLFLRHHDFTYAYGSGGLGTEWDAYAQVSLTHRLTALLKWADYHGVQTVPGRRKLWLQLDFNL